MSKFLKTVTWLAAKETLPTASAETDQKPTTGMPAFKEFFLAREVLPSLPPVTREYPTPRLSDMLLKVDVLPTISDSDKQPNKQPAFFAWLFSRETLPKSYPDQPSSPSTQSRR